MSDRGIEDRRRMHDRRSEVRGGRRITDKVACPNCGCLQSKVQPARQTVEQQQTGGYWRVRACMICDAEFETEEIFRRFRRHAHI
jgi:aspartate carbamoyltransferase regulatory subunit